MTTMLALTDWGWDDAHAAAFASRAIAGHEPGRILVEDRGSYLVATADSTSEARSALFRTRTGCAPELHATAR